MRSENILANVSARSTELFAMLRSLQSNPATAPYVLDVRGQGLMAAIEFASPAPVGGPRDALAVEGAPAGLASRVAKRCIEKGLLMLTTSVYEVVRLIPALNISEADMKKGCDIFVHAVEETVKEG